MNKTRGGTSLAAVDTRHESWFERRSWTVFVFLSAVVLRFGATDLPGATSSTARENAFNELFISCLSAAAAVMGLRRRQRWAWYAMALWASMDSRAVGGGRDCGQDRGNDDGDLVAGSRLRGVGVVLPSGIPRRHRVGCSHMPICIAKPGCHGVLRGGEMRRTEYSRRREEESCAVRGELLNRGSGVRVPAPAPRFVCKFG
jgi:hypothetical protein